MAYFTKVLLRTKISGNVLEDELERREIVFGDDEQTFFIRRYQDGKLLRFPHCNDEIITPDNTWSAEKINAVLGEGSSVYDVVSEVTVGGINDGEVVSGTTLQSFVEKLLMLYTPPVVNLSSNIATTTREFGNNIETMGLTASPIKGDNDITLLTISTSRNGQVAQQSPIVPAGEDLVYNTLCEDYGEITNDIVITATVSDDERTIIDTLNFQFVYPFYTGWVDEVNNISNNMTRDQLLALTGVDLLVKTKSSVNKTVTLLNGRFMIGYPASYGALSTIIDNTGFDTITDYFTFTANIIGLDETTQSYRFYVLRNDTTQTSFTNHFNF